MSLKHAILVLLETENGSGYDLLQQFNEGMGYFWNAKHQQIYQQLKKLSEDKYIEFSLEKQKGKPDRKVYAITQSGIEELKSWLAGPVKPAKVNDALLVKLYGGHLTNTENLLNELERHQTTHITTLNKLLKIEHTYLQLPSDKQSKYLLPYLTLRRGILGEKAWLTWAKEARKMIKI